MPSHLRYRFYPGTEQQSSGRQPDEEVSVTVGREAVTTLLHEVAEP